MKKILFLIITFICSQIFAATEVDADKFWGLYSQGTLEIATVFSRIRSSNDFESNKIVAIEAFLKRKAMFAALNLSQDDSLYVMQRYQFHVQSRTTIGLNIINATQKFSAEYQRIGALPGGKEFLQSIFKRPAVPGQ